MSLKTNEIKPSGGAIPKLLQPGNIVCKVNSIQLEKFKFKEGGYHIVLGLEGPDLGSTFEGFFIDKANEAKGRHKGQVGQVKASEWAYADGETKSGIKISRNDEIMKFVQNLLTALDAPKWVADQNEKHEDIEAFITALNTEKPFGTNTIEFCIGGKEYINKGGYTNHELFLPKYDKTGAPFGKTKVATFDTDKHIREKKVKPVGEFGSESTEVSSEIAPDFTL